MNGWRESMASCRAGFACHPGQRAAPWQAEPSLRKRLRRPGEPTRRGLTLIEVLLALAILAISIGSVAQLLSIGATAAASAEQTAIAQIVAESKMNELASGAMPLQAMGMTDDESRAGWRYSVDVTPIAEPAGLVSVKVAVEQVVEEGAIPITFELFRWMPEEGFLEIAPPTEEGTEEGATTEELPGSSSSGSGFGAAGGASSAGGGR